MNDKLSVKILDNDSKSKLVEDYNIEDYKNRDTNELAALLAFLENWLDELVDILANLSRDSGYDAVVAKIKSVKQMISDIASILSTRVDDTNVEDKKLVNLVKDDVVEVVDNGETRYETEEVVDKTIMLVNDVSYTVCSVQEYNDSVETPLTEEAFFYNLLCKFVELSIDNCISYSKKYLSDLDASVVSEIIEKNYAWHTLVGNFSINKAKLNSSLKMYPEKRNELLGLNYVKRDIAVKTKAPTSVQMSLFPEDNEFVATDLMPQGEEDYEQQ